MNKLSSAHVKLDVKSGAARVPMVRTSRRRRRKKRGTFSKAGERRVEEWDEEEETEGRI